MGLLDCIRRRIRAAWFLVNLMENGAVTTSLSPALLKDLNFIAFLFFLRRIKYFPTFKSAYRFSNKSI